MLTVDQALVAALVGVSASVPGAALDENLLANPGFELGGNTPEAWRLGELQPTVVIKRDERVVGEGAASLMLLKRASRYWPPSEIAQTFEREGDAPALEVSVLCRATRVTKVVLDVRFEGAGQREREWAVYIGAKEAGDPPVTHDWQPYTGTVAIPAWAETITVAAQTWGPGTARLDDISARYVDEPAPVPERPAEIASEFVTIEGDPNRRYVLIDADPETEPEDGHRVLVVLPGGDGSAEFRGFVEAIARRSLSGEYVVAQLVAPRWSMPEQLVWPIEQNPDPEMAFSTEAFVADVLDDVRARHRIDARHVYMLGWSSGGPPTYATTTAPGSPVRGAIAAMSVFKPDQLHEGADARGKAFYVLHSPEDFIDMRFPRAAERELRRMGAETTLVTYEGGHGWQGDRFGMIRDGVAWLEEHAADD